MRNRSFNSAGQEELVTKEPRLGARPSSFCPCPHTLRTSLFCMVDIIFHYPFLGAMGDHSKSKSFSLYVGVYVYVFNMHYF